MGLSVAEIIDQLITDIKEVTLLYSAPQGSQEPLVRTEISKMSHRQKQMVATLGDRYRSNEVIHPGTFRTRASSEAFFSRATSRHT